MSTIIVIGSFAESLLNFRGPLLAEMRRRGHRVIGCAPDASEDVLKGLEAIGVEYRHIDINRVAINPLKDIVMFMSMVRLITDIHPDIVFNYTIKPVIYGSLAAWFSRVPAIYSMITGLGYVFIGKRVKIVLLRLAVRLLYRLGLVSNRAVFFQNQDDLDLFRRYDLIRNQGQAVLVNGSGVDVTHYRAKPVPPCPSFLLIARLLKDKGVREYAEAARQVKQRHPKIPFRLAGWVDENPASISMELVLSWEQEGIIEFLGKLDDVRPALADCSVYVLPSYREGTPRTVLEAMATGRAIITTQAPGCRETIIEGENGFLVPVGDSAALAESMLRFIEKPALAVTMGARSRTLAMEKYEVNKVNQAILQSMDLS